MVAEWMVYCLLASAGLALVAALVERMLLAGRGPVRLVWIGAVALSLAIPVAAYRLSLRSIVEREAPALSLASDVPERIPITSDPLAPVPSAKFTATQTKPGRDWHAWLARYDQPLLIIWATLSFALVCNFLASVFVLMWMRRSWQQQTLQGIRVFVSDRSGPAVVGAIAPVIVLPKWAVALAPQQLDLMLHHEEQHRLAGDGRLLTIARLALIVMPWNVALWWQILRLRVAVELDCDARVLQNADARLYGDLLLEVASTSRAGQLLGATAFAERATQLERRIRMLSRHCVSTSRVARAVALSVGVVVLTVAWVAPHPAALPSTVAPKSVTSTTVTAPPVLNASAPNAKTTERPGSQPVVGDTIIMSRGVTRDSSGMRQTARTNSDSMSRVPKENQRGDTTVGTVTQLPPLSPVANSATDTAIINSARRAQAQQVDSALAILFNGILLTPSQETAARKLIITLQVQQTQQNLSYQLERTLAQRQRDSTLRTLLSESDRTILNSRVGPGGRGARIGGAGPLPDTSNPGTPGGRSNAGGRGRSGNPGGQSLAEGQAPGARGNANGGGRAANLPTPELLSAAGDATFRRLFDGISLTPMQDSIAHAAIMQFVRRSVNSNPPPAQLRVNLFTRSVSVSSPVDSALIELGTNASDKAMIRSRLTTLPPR